MASRPEPFVITLDGPAASGKSTVGRGAAHALGLFYFDTGLLYRALAWLALQQAVDPTDANALVDLLARSDMRLEQRQDQDPRVLVAGRDIGPYLHQPTVDASVSLVAAHGAVREALRPIQRAVIQPPGVVIAGRDIGTVIVPEAPLKVWLNANSAERARRRARQRGESFESVLEGMTARDLLDGTREVAPMRKAPDAVEVDTDGVSPAAVVERIVALARARQ